MLHLNAIFEAEGLNPGRIQLIRHKDSRLQELEGKSVFDVWFSDKGKFEEYQSIQRRRCAFEVGGLVASFVVSNSNETLFIGLYTVESRRESQANDWDPIWKRPLETGNFVHELRLTTDMSDYIRRLVITPWPDAINYVKKAIRCNPEILEIKRSLEQEPFPTYMRFRRRLGDLPHIFPAWQERLTEAKGIYLLTFTDGQQYVGSASGNQGFWQRWSDYVRTGHGGNRVLIRENRDAKEATVSILEVTGSALTTREIIDREMIWQTKLGSRAKRLENE